MGYRARLAALAVVAALCIGLGLAGRAPGQGTRKLVPANKNIRAATPALFATLPRGSSVTYRVELKRGRTFTEANGDGFEITTTGNIQVAATRRVSDTVFEADFMSVNNGEAGLADIRINLTTKKGKLVFVRGGVSFGGDEVVTINTSNRAILQRVSVGQVPVGIDAVASGASFVGRAFVCNSAESTVSVIDIPSNLETNTIGVGTDPRYVAVVGPIGNEFAYVTNFGSDTVSVIDAESLAVIATIPVGDGPVGIDFTGQPAAAQALYVANQNSNTVTVIDARTNAVTATVPVGNGPTGVAVAGPFGAQVVVVTESRANTVTLLNSSNNTIIADVAVGSQPVFAAVGGVTLDQIWVVNNGSRSVSLVNLNTRAVDANVTVGGAPTGAVVTGPGSAQEIYVTNSADGTVSVINANQRATVATIFVGGRPRADAVIGVTGAQRVLVSN
jgi:YVTN family beta-propeller protein